MLIYIILKWFIPVKKEVYNSLKVVYYMTCSVDKYGTFKLWIWEKEMKALSLYNIKKEIKNIPGRHIALTFAAAVIFSLIAVIRLPLGIMDFSTALFIAAFFVVLIPLFIFYLLVKFPKTSVFKVIKCVYCICTPFVLMFTADVLFDPNDAELNPDSFHGSFMVRWILVWWVGMVLLYALLRLLSHLIRAGYSKHNALAVFIYDLAVMFTPQKRIAAKKDEKNRTAVFILCVLMVALGVFIASVTLFLYNIYSNMEFEAILFTMLYSAGTLAIEDIITGTEYTLLFLAVAGYISYHLFKCYRHDTITVADTGKEEYTLRMNGKKRALLVVFSCLVMIGGFSWFAKQTKFIHYISVKSETSDIYENYYVEPTASNVVFPAEKRNLIFIYLESMESTYADRTNGGYMQKNYIPELTDMAANGINFSNTDKLGGASVYVPSITYTMGSTVAQTSGVVTDTKLSRIFQPKEFPNVTTLEDILHENGYNRIYIEGSKGEFSMYDIYMERYDDSVVIDRTAASELGYTDESEDYIWKWGIEDRKLYEVTKELITDAAKQDKPFFVTMYTMDTHTFECGHRCPECDDGINHDYLASLACSSQLTAEFVDWVKAQPFYENTTIILVGDHLGNEKTTILSIDDDYIRTTYNCFINAPKTPVNTKNRIFSSLDMFPTTLSAMGATIKGDRLGLGTDLFSSTPTLCEELGVEEYKKQLEMSNKWVNSQ